jgi:hypothetical protein
VFEIHDNTINQSQITMKHRIFSFGRSLAICLAAAFTAATASAVNIYKADNADNLNLTTSWTNGVTPTSSDVAVWDSTVTSANTTLLGADANWAGIQILNPAGLITINAGNTLTNGASGN